MDELYKLEHISPPNNPLELHSNQTWFKSLKSIHAFKADRRQYIILNFPNPRWFLTQDDYSKGYKWIHLNSKC